LAIHAEHPELVDLLADAIPELKAAYSLAKQRSSEADIYRVAVEEYVLANELIWRPGRAEDVEQLYDLGLPEAAVVFYRHFEPWQWVWELRFHGAAEIIYYNDPEISPNPHLRRLGFIEFASTSSGDTFHYALTDFSSRGMPGVYLLSHELLGQQNEKELRQSARKVADDLVDMLTKATQGLLDTRV
jgi:hypothetical protein